MKSLRVRKRTVWLVCAGALLGGAISGAYWLTGTPRYSLWQLRKSIDDHDLATAEEYVDFRGVAESIVTGLMEQAQERERKGPVGDEWERAGRAMGMGLMAMMKPRLVDETTSALKKVVEGQHQPTNDIGKLARPSFYSSPEISTDGKVGTLKLTFDAQANGLVPVVFKIRQRERRWQIAEILNAREILAKVDTKSAAAAGR